MTDTDFKLLQTPVYNLHVYLQKFTGNYFNVEFRHKFWYLWTLTINVFKFGMCIEVCRRDWHATYRLTDNAFYQSQIAEQFWEPVPDKLFRKWCMKHMSDAIEAYNTSNDIDPVIEETVKAYYEGKLRNCKVAS